MGGTNSHGIQVVLVNNRDFSRVTRSRLNGVLVKLPVVANHVKLPLHGGVPEGLLNLVVTGKEDDPLLGSKES